MKRALKVLAGIAAFAPMVLSAQVVNQNQPSNTVNMANFSQTNLAQSFKQSVGNISGAGIFTRQDIGSGSSVITINLWNLLPNAIGATKLATGSANSSAPGQWVDVFWSQLSIVTGQTYYLEFLSTNNTYAVGGDTGNPYADGQVYANAGFQPFSTYDYTFRTYSGQSTSVVPEPATVSLMFGGLAALFAVARRRKGKALSA